MFASVQDVNDKLGRVLENQSELWISSGGKFSIETAERLLTIKSGNINRYHGMNYDQTTVTNEYYDIIGNPHIVLRKFPVISISSLALWNGTEYEAQTEGNNRITDDFYIEDSDAGMVRFWSQPSSGKRMARVTYSYGYATIPDYVKDCCAYMVAVEIGMSREFMEKCKDEGRKWKIIIEQWSKKIDKLLDEIKQTPLGVEMFGKFYQKSALDELEELDD